MAARKTPRIPLSVGHFRPNYRPAVAMAAIQLNIIEACLVKQFVSFVPCVILRVGRIKLIVDNNPARLRIKSAPNGAQISVQRQRHQVTQPEIQKEREIEQPGDAEKNAVR